MLPSIATVRQARTTNTDISDVIDSKHFLSHQDVVVPRHSRAGALSGELTIDRRRSVQIGVLGGTLQAVAVHLSTMFIGHAIAGWAVGIVHMALPVYQAEAVHLRSHGLTEGEPKTSSAASTRPVAPPPR